MRSSTRFFAVVLLTLLCIPVCLRAQSQTRTAVKTPRGSVSGRVTIKDKPAAGITVGLRPTMNMFGTEKSYRALTDQEGVYRITNVPAGTYDIMIAAPAYVTPDVSPGARGKNVIVAEDENIEDINFSLVRGGVITGKITDSDGRPLVQQQVNIFRAADSQQPQQQRQVFPSAGNVHTDDRGIYRIFGLAPGRYKIASGRGDDTSSGGYYEPSRVIYKQVFHPDATDQAKATIIDVKEGSETANVDITMGIPIQTFSASGRVIDAEKGLPVPNVRFFFQRRAGEGYQFSDISAVSNVQGDFIAEGLQPGKYGIMLFGNPNQDMRVENVTFDVIDSDVSGLTVRMIKGSSISGVVVLEPENKKAFAQLAEFQLRAFVTAPSGSPASFGASIFSPIGPDGSFRLTGLSPGQVNFWLTPPFGGRMPKGFAILRTEHNGVVSPRGMEIKDGDQLTGVRIVMSYGTATIHGTVKLENGVLPEGGRLFARVVKPGTPPAQIASSAVDARNQFLLEGVPAGIYELSVTVFLPNNRTQANVKREISVQEGIVNQVSITVDLTPQPQPPPKP